MRVHDALIRICRERVAGAVFAFVLLAFAVPLRAEADYSMATANRYLLAHQWDDLLRYSQAWTKAKSNDADAWYYLGETYSIGFERPADAVGPLRRAVALRPNWAQAWNSVGLVETKLKQSREAAAAFRKAVDQSPRTMNYWFNLASAQSALGDFDGAHASLTKAASTAGPSTGYADWYNLGLGFNQIRDCGNAAKAYAEALRRNPKMAEGWNNLGACQQQLGRIEEARRSYRQAAALGHSFAAANLTRMEQQQRARAASGGGNGPNLYDQYRQRQSCSSGGSGVGGPCSEADRRPQ